MIKKVIFLIEGNAAKAISSSKEFIIQFDHYGGTRHYKFDLTSIPKECKK
tara:strand:- start:367 stop:516 length:150 start_codon:yes stop_codon:yes gene_type:complete